MSHSQPHSSIVQYQRALRMLLLACLAALTGCQGKRATVAGEGGPGQTLVQARQAHKTRLTRQVRGGDPVPKPPAGDLRIVSYPSPAGKLTAYVSPAPKGGKKHAAIIWISGGFDNGIGETAWEEAHPDNDQSARVFRREGIVTMYPSFRGGNRNPGVREGLYGEVEDTISAAKWLAAQPNVDPKRIYLGGHSTGGTLALLVSECTGGFRAVFSLGPVEDIRGYGQDELPFDISDEKEAMLRSPILWLNSISRPTYVIEGGRGTSNVDSLRAIARDNRNPHVHCYEFPQHDHFTILAPITYEVAQRIKQDTGPEVKMSFPGTLLSAQ